QHIPEVGLVKFKDNESGKVIWADTSSKEFQKQFKLNHVKREAAMKDLFNKCGVDYCDIYTHEGYIKPLMSLFKRR
ncbi:MAG: DUF58 domain-containing protein, partial [Bacteroidia bacterium]